MAKCKYTGDFPLLAEGMARRGMTDEQIAEKLGISKDTFYQYIKKYPDFSDSLKRGKSPVDVEVENALLKRALGYDYEETTTEYSSLEKSGKNGDKANANKGEWKVVKKTKKFIPPDVTAQIFWLKNRRPDLWKDRTDANHTITDQTALASQKALFDSMTYEEKEKWLETHRQ
jgi:predicted transcriptional regulator